MHSDQDKFLQIGRQLWHQWQTSAHEMALIIFGVVLVAGILAGTALAIWIFRGGLSWRPLRD